MSESTRDRRALDALNSESDAERIAYYRTPFMILWAAVQEASAELQEDYGLSEELARLWVAEQLRRTADSLVDRLAEKAAAHGISNANIARAAGASPSNATRRFPRLACADSSPMLIDTILDTLDL